MRKRFLMTGVAIVLALSMTGCGKSSSETTTENATSEEVASETDMATAMDAAADTEEATTEEEDTSWFSENNISFTEGEVSIPAYAYAQKDDGTLDDRIEVTQKEATFAEPVISASEVDSDGNITYTVTYEVSGTWSGMVPASVASFNQGTLVGGWEFVDAYTGTVFPVAGIKGDDSYAIESTVEVDGKEYKILTSRSNEWNHDEGRWSDDALRYTSSYTGSTTMTAVVPAEYDGLILCMDGNGKTEYEEIDTEVKGAHPFDYDIATTIFKDVTYGKIVALKAGDMYLAYSGSENDEIHAVLLMNNQLTWYSYTKWEQEEVCDDGFVKIKWKDGTCTNIENDHFGRWDNPDGDYGYALFFNPIDISQVQSVVIGDEEFSKGQARSVEWFNRIV